MSNSAGKCFVRTLHSRLCEGTQHDVDVMRNATFHALGVTNIYQANYEFYLKYDYYYAHCFDKNPLISALFAKHLKCTEFLLNLGLSPNDLLFVGDDYIVPPLQIPIEIPIPPRDYSMIELLLKYGANPNAQLSLDSIPISCLSYACLVGDLTLLKLFLRYKANIEHISYSVFLNPPFLDEVWLDSLSCCVKLGNPNTLMMLYLRGSAFDCPGRFKELNRTRVSSNMLPLTYCMYNPLCHDMFQKGSIPILLPTEAKEDYEKCLEILREGGVTFWEKNIHGERFVHTEQYEALAIARPRLMKFIRDSMSNPLSLKSLARIRIKKSLNGKTYLRKIKMLKLPPSIVDYLAFDDLVPCTLTDM